MKYLLFFILFLISLGFLYSLRQFTLYNGFGDVFEYVPVQKNEIKRDTTRMPMRIMYSYFVNGKLYEDYQNVSPEVAKLTNLDTLTILYNKSFRYSILKGITGKSQKTQDYKTGMIISSIFFLIFFLIYKFGDLKKWEGVYFRGKYVVHKQPTKASQLIKRSVNGIVFVVAAFLLIRLLWSLLLVFAYNGFGEVFEYREIHAVSQTELDSIYLQKRIDYTYTVDNKKYHVSQQVSYKKIQEYGFYENKIYYNASLPFLSYAGSNRVPIDKYVTKVILSIVFIFVLALLFAHINLNRIHEIIQTRKKRNEKRHLVQTEKHK